MFGGSMFDDEGGDVNAGALSAEESSGFSGGYDASGGQGGGGYEYGQGMPGGSFTNDSGMRSGTADPASFYAGQAEFAADKYSSAGEANGVTAQQIAAGINRAVGLSSAIGQLAGYRWRNLAKQQRIMSRMQAKAGIDNAQRAIDQYKEDSQREEQQLSQSYAGRGLGESSIFNEGMQYYRDTEARKMASLQQGLTLAQQQAKLVKSQIAASYAAKWDSFGNSVMNLV